MVTVGDNAPYGEAELIFGLVAPVGTGFDRFVETLVVGLKEFRYQASLIRVSDLAASFEVEGVEARMKMRSMVASASEPETRFNSLTCSSLSTTSMV
jgi:hypothetical protein